MEGLNNSTEESQAKNIVEKYDNLLDFYCYYMQPMCHKIGLTLDQFWYDDPELYFAYLEAYNEDEKNKLQKDNLLAYINGSYTLMALGQLFSSKKVFPDKPIDLGLDKKKSNSVEEQNEAWLGYFKSKLKLGEQSE